MSTTNQVKKIILVLIIFFSISISFASESLAADVSFGVPAQVWIGDTFEVVIFADTDEELVNSIDMAVGYDALVLSYVGYENESVGVKFWVSPPQLKDGKVQFAGIIPGGVEGVYDVKKSELGPIPLTRLLFRADGEGETSLFFLKTEILKNDGFGTPLIHDVKNVSLLVGENDNNSPVPPLSTDASIPNPFSVTFLESSSYSNTPSMIIFNAYDTDGAIKKYQIKTGANEWRDVTSPHEVRKAMFPRNVTIRAIDFNDNFRDETVRIPGMWNIKFPFIFILILVLLILSSLWFYKLIKYKL